MKNFKLNFKSIVQRKARWLLTIIAILTLGVGQMRGEISFTVGVTGTGSSSDYGGSDYNKMKLCAQFRWDDTDKGEIINEMDRAGITFEGKDLYITYMKYNDAIQTRHMYFQKYKNSTQVWYWDANGSTQSGDYWNSRIVKYGNSRYDQKSNKAGAHFYFDASNWSQTAIKLVVGHTYYQYYYAMSHVENTKLYYLTTSKYDNFAGLGVVGGTNRANGGHSEQLTYVSVNASEYTGWKNYDFTTTTANTAYLMVNNGKAGQEPTMSYHSSFTTSGQLNYNQTVLYVLRKDGGSYSNMSSGKTPAKISMRSYKFVSDIYSSVSAVNPTAMSLGGTTYSTTFTAARTATTTVTVSNIDPGYVFDGWYDATTGGNLLSSNKSYTYYPTSAKTVYARFTKVYGFIEGKFAIGNADRDGTMYYTASNGSWVLNSTNIPMSWDETNHRLYVHTYSKPSELKAQINSNDPWFIIKTSSASNSVDDNGAEFWAAEDTDAGKKLTAAGRANGKAIGSTSGSFTFLTNTGTTGYAIIYCDSSKVWYELEYMLEYDANGATSGSIPTGRTYHLSGTTPTAATNSNSLELTGYDFNGWSTSSGVGQTPTYSAGATMSSMSADVKLYAAWAAQTYNIIYKDQGNVAYSGNNEGSLPDTHTYNIATALVDGSKAGYDFVGWYTVPACTEDPITSLGATDYTSGDITLYAKWSAKTYTEGVLDKGAGTRDGEYSVTFNDTKIVIAEGDKPIRSGYRVEGYYYSYDSEHDTWGAHIAAPDGTLSASTSYTDANGKWTYSSEPLPSLITRWTAETYTITLDENLPSGTTGVAGATQFTVSFNDINYSFGDNLSSRPQAEGYTFEGYYTDDVPAVQVIKKDGSINTSTAYIGGTGRWVHPGNVTLYARWDDDYQYYYKGATANGWSTAGNWTKGKVPSTENKDTIHILKPLEISATTNVAAVDIITNGSYSPTGGSAILASGKLTIQPNVGLNVLGTISRTTDATSGLATREEDLILESSSAGNASLIFDNSYSCQATVQMYSKASISGSTWNWQYVGTPFTGSIPLYNYYGSWMYKWNGGWAVVHGGDELTPFAGYCLTQESATTHVMGGILVPTTTSGSISVSSDMVLANSWTAPIYIGGFTEETFT